jgi:hypothetical protein
MSTSTDARRLVIAGLVGNVMEWYDFVVHGDFAELPRESRV